MAVWLYLIKVARTLHQSLSPGLSGFDWPCLLSFNVKWQTEDMSIVPPLFFQGSCPWMEETRGERGGGGGVGRFEVSVLKFLFLGLLFLFLNDLLTCICKSFSLSLTDSLTSTFHTSFIFVSASQRALHVCMYLSCIADE